MSASNASLVWPELGTQTVPSPRALGGGSDGLHFQSLVHPPVGSARGTSNTPRAGVAGVWMGQRHAFEQDATLLTHRHLALQSVQMRLMQITDAWCRSANPLLRLFVDGGLRDVYLGTEEFERRAGAVRGVQGKPANEPAYIDEDRLQWVMDSQRFFLEGTAKLLPAAFKAVVLAFESHGFQAQLGGQLKDGRLCQRPQARCDRLKATVRGLARHALGEPGIVLTAPTRSAVHHIGWPGITRAFFGGSGRDIEMLCDVFESVAAGHTGAG